MHFFVHGQKKESTAFLFRLKRASTLFWFLLKQMNRIFPRFPVLKDNVFKENLEHSYSEVGFRGWRTSPSDKNNNASTFSTLSTMQPTMEIKLAGGPNQNYCVKKVQELSRRTRKPGAFMMTDLTSRLEQPSPLPVT